MEREDVVNVLSRFREALTPSGLILDLQVVPPQPVVEVDGADVCEVEGDSLLDAAGAATAIVDGLVERGVLHEEGRHDHVVRRHFSSGADLVAHFETRTRSLPAEAVPMLAKVDRPCAVREPCRARGLRNTEVSLAPTPGGSRSR